MGRVETNGVQRSSVSYHQIQTQNEINMKLIKWTLKLLAGLFSVLLILFIVSIVLERSQLAYLKKSSSSVENESILIENVHLIPMDKDTIYASTSLLIKNGKIEQLGDDIQVDADRRIDAEGGYLMPGLMDMHVHVWDKFEFGLYLASGVTAVRSLWGLPMHIRWKNQLAKDKWHGPAFLASGPKLSGPSSPGSDKVMVPDAATAKEMMRSYKERGYDLIKTYYGIEADVYEALLEEAEALDMIIAAHPSPQLAYHDHFDKQVKTIEHVEDIYQQGLNYQLDSVKLEEVLKEFKEAGTTMLCPTAISFYNIINLIEAEQLEDIEKGTYINPMFRMVAEGEFNRWKNEQANNSNRKDQLVAQHNFHLYVLRRMHEEGLELVCGTDSGIGVTAPGSSIIEELHFYKEAGLSNYEVLKTATVNAASLHEEFSNMGTIAAGKDANLILLEVNPLEDLNALKEIKTVFNNGAVLDRNTLDEFVAKAKDRNNLIPSVLRYLEHLIFERNLY